MKDDFGLIPHNESLLIVYAENIKNIVLSGDVYIYELSI